MKNICTKQHKQILAITGKIKKGKARNPDKAKAKVYQIRSLISKQNWLAQ
jgi:hypothetical protein